MGTRAEAMVGQSVESLVNLDVELARAVLAKDDEIDELDLLIENKCMRILALQQPQASDLRRIGTAMKMNTDLERVGDLAVDIARITLKVDQEFGQTHIIDLPRIAGVARHMLRLSLESFVKRDLQLCRQVALMDDQVDSLYREMREHLFQNMRKTNDSAVADGWLLMSLHHVERIADHAVNIVERVAFMITGDLSGKRALTQVDSEN